MDVEFEVDGGLEARAQSLVGETLRKKYRLDRVLGIGGMATVYAATHRNGKEVALKLLHPEFGARTDVRSRFLREGYVANQVRHVGAVSVLDDDVTETGAAFLVMELLHGVTVQDLWESQKHRVGAACVTAITLQLLDVIASAHAHGIVHRDLKPANLFVTDEGELKVLDFGIARMRASGAQTTNLHAVLGTPAFMAPEQAMGRMAEVDERTDLWAVAAVAFALLSGDVVHPAESSQATLIFAATRPARALGPLAGGAPPDVVDVIERALAYDRAARWPSARAMRDALASAAAAAYGELPAASVLREAARLARAQEGFGPRGRTSDASPTRAPETASSPGAAVVRARARAPGAPMRLALESAAASIAGLASVGPVVAASRVSRAGALLLVLGAAVIAIAGVSAAQARAVGRPLEGASSAATPGHVVASDLLRSVSAEPLPPLASTAPPAPVMDVARPAPSAASPPDPSPAAAAPQRGPALPAGRRGRCSPPFVIEATTGLKKWKLECL